MLTRRKFIINSIAILAGSVLLYKGIKVFGDVDLTVGDALNNLSNLYQQVLNYSSISEYSSQDILNAIAYSYSYLSQFPQTSSVYSVLPSLFNPPSGLSVGPEEIYRLATISNVNELSIFLDQYTSSINDFTEKIQAFGYTQPSPHKVLFTQYLSNNLRVRVMMNFYPYDISLTPVPEYEPIGLLEYYQNGSWSQIGLICRSHWYPYIIYLQDLMDQQLKVNVTSDLPPVYYSGNVFIPRINPFTFFSALDFIYGQFEDEQNQIISSLKSYGYYYVYPWEALAWIVINQADIPVQWNFSPYNRLSLLPDVFTQGNDPNATPYLPPSSYL
ncbi:hypothetical protein [Stygiolobus caldivivus]|uniref:Uncharacterized protein n=1 Tax=Stygiolobus caldivivus TaxID=2824673 RepID=A0A8D5U8E1_9CREN|nr:hypothetical protein [Stygiolobus caldivivus]BCU71097.1 hypothetical protein KN1_23940 [Stygiolobus caldivivus]